MKEEIVSFDLALLANEKGFKEITNQHYHREEKELFYSHSRNFASYKSSWAIPAPTQSFLQKWLRETHEINIWVVPYGHMYRYFISNKESDLHSNSDFADSYEQALEQALEVALGWLKDS